MTEEEINLNELLIISPSVFLNQCVTKFEKGEKSDFCTYVQLKVLKDSGKTLDSLEESMLLSLFSRYGEIDTSALMYEYERHNQINTVDNVVLHLDNVLKDMRLSVRKVHEKNPQDGYAGFLGFLNEIWANRKNNRGFTYNAENVKELSQYFFESKTRIYRITDNISIKLIPGVLLHILVGHVEKYYIPRKGAGVIFSHVKDAKELLVLLEKIIQLLSNDLFEHYSSGASNYDNNCIQFENCLYGIHIDKKYRIKTFYEINTNANILYK